MHAGQAGPGPVRSEELAHLVLRPPGGGVATGAQAPDELEVGEIAGGQAVEAPLAVQRQDVDRPLADPGDLPQPRPSALVIRPPQVGAAAGPLPGGPPER